MGHDGVRGTTLEANFVSTAASAAAFGVGITATQMIGAACRVSCATPLLGSALGLLGIGISAAAAGQASRRTQGWYKGQGPHPLAWPPWHSLNRRDVFLDALGGVILWRILGGRYSAVMPSDIARQGAFAKRCIPARARSQGKSFVPQYGTSNELKTISEYFSKDGCHHCGTRRGPVIGDHIPPNVVAYGAGYKARLQVSRSPTAPSPQAKQALLKALKFVGVKEPTAKVKKLAAMLEAAGPRQASSASTHASRMHKFGWAQRAVRRVMSTMGFRVGPPRQSLFPQCSDCSAIQSVAVRSGRHTFVTHYSALRQYHLVGPAIGAWQLVPVLRPSNSSGSKPSAAWLPFQGYNVSGHPDSTPSSAELRQNLRQLQRREAAILQQRRNGTSQEPAATAELLTLWWVFALP